MRPQDFDFELIGIDGNPLSAGEGGPSPVNGITSLVFERSQWITLSDISLELPDGREPGKKYLWPNQAFTYDQRYSMDIGRDDATKAKVNDNTAGEPVGLFETWAEINGGSLSTLGGWAITDIVVSGNKVEKFTVSHGSGGSGMGEGPAFTLTADGLLQTARVLDHEEASRHELGIRATGANGESLEGIFEVKVGDEFRPIVRTVRPTVMDHEETAEMSLVAEVHKLGAGTPIEAGQPVGRLTILDEDGLRQAGEFEPVGQSVDYIPEETSPSSEESGPSQVNGITSLSFERSNWIVLSEVSLELPDGREPGKKYSWPKQAFTYDQLYSMDIGRDDATKAKVNDNMAGEPVGLFETWAEISGGKLSTLGNWTITDIVVSGDRVESFT